MKKRPVVCHEFVDINTSINNGEIFCYYTVSIDVNLTLLKALKLVKSIKGFRNPTTESVCVLECTLEGFSDYLKFLFTGKTVSLYCVLDGESFNEFSNNRLISDYIPTTDNIDRVLCTTSQPATLHKNYYQETPPYMIETDDQVVKFINFLNIGSDDSVVVGNPSLLGIIPIIDSDKIKVFNLKELGGYISKKLKTMEVGS